MARLQSPRERLQYLRNAVRDETDPLVTITHLLHLCRDEHRVLWEQAVDAQIRAAVTSILRPVQATAASRAAQAEVDAPMRSALADALAPGGGVAPVIVAHALAQLLDEHYGGFLASSFQRRSPYQPGVGDPIPLGVHDIRAVMDIRPTSPPWRLANRLDETRRVRLAGEWATQFRIVFDYDLFYTLANLITVDTVIATAHPNRGLADFTLPPDPRQPAFPIRPTSLARQHRVIDRLIRSAVDADASIVVLPELCVTDGLARTLQQWVRQNEGPRLLVAGSYHHVGGSPRRRRNTAIGWVRGHPQPLVHDKHSAAEHPICEDIQPQGWPELRVYVSADGWHLVLAICRDLLNPQAVHALTEAGANLVLVPAMSESLTPFTGQIAHLVSSGQALVAVANNPAEWADSTGHAMARPARALFGHPGLGQQTRLVASSDSTPGIATIQVRTALIGWSRIDSEPAPQVPSADRHPLPGALPAWVESLAAVLRPGYEQSVPADRDMVRLRPAAVLVLLTDGPAGPRVLLTERALELGDYPGRLTFPGGVCDRDDTGPIITATREAAEEIGLDPASVHPLGVLPALADAESKFLVTPVVAWSGHPRYRGTVNPAEVVLVRDIDLREIAAFMGEANRPQPQHLAGGGSAPPLSRLGVLTATVIDTLLGVLTATHCQLDTAN